MATKLDEKFDKSFFILIGKDAKKYHKKWVAISLFDGEVLSFDKEFKKVQEEVEKRGYLNPLMFYVPDSELSQIYPTLY
ncbi:MAG TPA: DUF5678 domain-containing protein [Candidatus Paceibacterota bacterium]|nr:DUF5678 domain-containing protein [Candidatus Paceibacterota bacterium]